MIQSNAADNASDAQRKAADAATAEQRREYDLMRGDLAPYTGAGTNALAQLDAANHGDYSGFEDSPDYLYARDQAQYVSDHGAASAGDLYSGGHSLDLGREIAGLASQNFGSYRNNLMQLAGLGQASAAGVGAAGMSMANNIGGYLTNAGDASANAYLANGNNQANLLSQLGQIGGSYFGNRADTQTLNNGAPGVDTGSMGSVNAPEYDWS